MSVTIKSPAQVMTGWLGRVKKEHRTAFVSAFVMGLLIHMPALLSDIPNHDGLSSMYFDQNMITSGRWFLMVACGFSSFYTIPWVIGLLGLLFLSCAAVALTDFLELKDAPAIVSVSGLLVSFPALASTFAYVFTMDGYMLALCLAVAAVACTKNWKKGFIPGAVCLAFSMGIYQAYLPFAILLCMYGVAMVFMDGGSLWERCRAALRYLYMGLLGVALYYVILQVLLLIQGKELASYQGIDGLGTGAAGWDWDGIAHIYRDFVGFSLKGNVVFHGPLSFAACALLLCAALLAVCRLALRRKWWKCPGFFAIMAVMAVAAPFATNVILLISPELTYHLLMRYQWVVWLILAVALVSRFAGEDAKGNLLQWVGLGAALVLVFHYAVTDNIGYSNLQRKYEKTYAYCARLLDRIEQTEGYYQGIPIAMVGVVGDDPYPVTDITLPVTSNMIGLNGDFLLYTGENYRIFMQNYLGATLNIMTVEEMGDIYYSPEYIGMESFPAESSVKIVDGIMYIKTENAGRD
ncbi:MAG: glucosyltransferase domain-containing protein [Clostridium sp.]|nr:glucosyltransferase domain-containing protein [Acetatifactor muris]MCM1525916.1 glucosyltransferase domain-containing protein [Bacteroides sp.]MCM1562545.1 glucosyltransferase domain-containing protein [Clostridium sp.]